MGQREAPPAPSSVSAHGLAGPETEQDIREAFEAFGPVTSIAVHGSRCLVSFARPEEAQKALDNRKVVVRATGAALSVFPWAGQQRAPRTLLVPRGLTNSWDISAFVAQVDGLLPDASSGRERELKRDIRDLLAGYSGFRVPGPQEIKAMNMAARPRRPRGHQPRAERKVASPEAPEAGGRDEVMDEDIWG